MNKRSLHDNLHEDPPRRIGVTLKGGLFISLILAISLGFTLFACQLYLDDAREIRNGNDLAKEGQIVDASQVRVGGIAGWSVSYTFTYDGREYSGRAHVPKKNQNEMSRYETSAFPIVFLPSNPSVNYPKNWSEPKSHSWLVYAVLLLIPSCLCLTRGKDIHLDYQLVRNGRVTLGTVTGQRYSKSGNLELQYEFRDSEDLPVEGAGYSPVSVKKGEEICVLYLPQESGQNRPYPLFYFRAKGSLGSVVQPQAPA